MKKISLLIILSVMLMFGCSEQSNELVNVKIVSYSPTVIENKGDFFLEIYIPEYWICENVLTKERHKLYTKYGELGDTFAIQKNSLY